MDRAIARARESGIPPSQTLDLYRALFTATVWGHMTVDRAMDRWKETLEWASGALEGFAFGAMASLHAMRGEFDTARGYLDRNTRRLLEVGMTLPVTANHLAAFVEDLAGNVPEMERMMRRSVEALRAAGETGFLSTSAATHAEALRRLGRFDEALEATRLSEQTAAPDDVASQSQWRAVRAKIAAVQGRLDEAERLARDAVAISDATDHLNQIGYSYLSLAEVLRAAGRRAEAEAAARR